MAHLVIFTKILKNYRLNIPFAFGTIYVLENGIFISMKNLIYILIGLFVLCSTSNESYGQLFGAKKKGEASTKGRKGDAFSGKSKKGPNIYSSKPPKTKSRSKLYGHSISKKKARKNNNSSFSSTKRRYKSVNSKPKGAGDKEGNPSSGGRKSGKGRKKDK